MHFIYITVYIDYIITIHTYAKYSIILIAITGKD